MAIKKSELYSSLWAGCDELGGGKEMVDRLTNLTAIFENPALDFSKNRAEGDDILGGAYETPLPELDRRAAEMERNVKKHLEKMGFPA